MNEASIEDLVAEYIERREAGETVSAETFAGAHPRVADRLLRAIRAAEGAEHLLPDGDATPPARIGDWRVLGWLGQGGAGRVLEVESAAEPGRSFALKTPNLAGLCDARALERFRREGEALGRLHHPGIVAIREVGLFEGRPYIVMDRVRGPSLGNLLEDQERLQGVLGIPPDRGAARLLREVGDALAAAHSIGLVHRDVKPGNIMLDEGGRPMLLDFGLVGDAEALTLTGTGDLLGTPRYMSPEQARGERSRTCSDVFALGAILHEILSGSAPQEPGAGDGKSQEDLAARMRRRREEPVAPIATKGLPIDRELARIVDRALAFDPAERYADAASFVSDLDAYLEGRPLARKPWRLRPRLARVLKRRSSQVAIGLLIALVSVVLARDAERRRHEMDLKVRVEADDALARVIGCFLDGRPQDAGPDIDRLALLPSSDPALRVLRSRARNEAPAAETERGMVELAAGETRRRAGDAGGAISEFHEAAARLGTSAIPGLLLALTALDDGRLELASRELAVLSRRFPDRPAIALAQARLDYRRKDFEEAMRSAGQALEAAPDDLKLLEIFARAAGQAGQVEEGIRAARHADEIAQGSDIKVLTDLAALLDRNENFVESIAILEKLVARHPEKRSLRYNLALVYDRAHESHRSLPLLEGIVTERPDTTSVLMLLTSIHAGGRIGSCSRCEAYYAEHPEVLDRLKARSWLLRAFDPVMRGDGKFDDLYVDFARRTGAEGEVVDRARTALEVLAAATTSGSREEQDLRRRRLQSLIGALSSGGPDH